VPVESLFDLGLAGAQIVQRGVEVVLIEALQAEHFRDRMVLGPACGGEAGALMGHAGQDQEQGEFGQTSFTQGGGEAEGIGQRLEGKQQAEHQTAGGVHGFEVIQFAAEQALEGVDAGGGPSREVGEGTVLDLAVLAEGFPEEDGGRGGAVGDGGHVHASIVSQICYHYKMIINIYMTTQ
jgi:hypothetical protein